MKRQYRRCKYELPELTPEEDYALGFLRPTTYREMGTLIGLSHETVHAIECRAMAKLKSAARELHEERSEVDVVEPWQWRGGR